MPGPIEPNRLDSQVRAFEQSWRQRSTPAIVDFVPVDCDVQTRLEILAELICVDLEFRWRAIRDGQAWVRPLSLMEYAQSHSELGDAAELPLELIGEDYRARTLWGDKPSHETILGGFPRRVSEIAARLQLIDRELLAETAEVRVFDSRSQPHQPVVPYDGKPDPKAPLAYSDYKLQNLIGAGLMGRVYRAWQQSLDRPVAVKYLRKSFHHDTEAVERFLAEARTVAKLRHPHLVGIHGLGRTPQGGYFLVMDWIEGSDLARILQKERPVSIADAVRWTLEAGSAIRKAHEQGIIHCDLKPGNILLDLDRRVHVTDFGMSRSLAEESPMQDRIEGTAPFMAPEQVSRHWGPIDARTDIYGLGAVLYTLFTGVPPCQGRTLADVLANAVSANPVTPPEGLRADVPPELNQVCLRSLRKEPSERFQSIDEFAEQLRAAMTE
jgi:tRNA A-37 threonylcarbamoyl transferase component Bud32